SVILNSVHEAGMVIEPTLYCIASLPSITVAQSVTTAAALPLAAAGAVDSAAAGSVAGAGSGVATAGSAVCAVAGASAGAVVSVVSGDCPPHAARAKAQAVARRVARVFMCRLRVGTRHYRQSACACG